MIKFLIGVATAAVWFALSHAANAQQVCKPACSIQVASIGVEIGR